MIRRSIESITNLDELKKIQTQINIFLSSQASTGDTYKNLRDAVNDHIVKFNDSQKTTTDKLTKYDKEFNDHVKNYNQFRKNVINKFFGSPMEVTLTLAGIKITFDKFFGKYTKPEDVTQTLDEIKTSIDGIKAITLNQERILKIINSRITEINSLPMTTLITNKIKMPHEVNSIHNIVYLVDRGYINFIQGGKFNFTRPSFVLNVFFTVFFEYQFNITAEAISVTTYARTQIGKEVNVISILMKKTYAGNNIIIEPVDTTVVRARVDWYLEFVLEIVS